MKREQFPVPEPLPGPEQTPRPPEAAKPMETAELEAALRERKEQREFFDAMQQEEQETTGGILSRFQEIPKGLKRAVMALATVGVLLAAHESFAGDYRSYEGWQKHFGYKEPVSPGQEQLESRRQVAYHEFQQRVAQIQQWYDEQRVQIMQTRPHEVRQAIAELDAWKEFELHKARTVWSVKSWALEEESRMRAQQERR